MINISHDIEYSRRDRLMPMWFPGKREKNPPASGDCKASQIFRNWQGLDPTKRNYFPAALIMI